MKVISLLAVVFQIMSVWAAPGLGQETKPLTLADAVELALKNNRQIQAAMQQAEAAKSGVGQARAAFFPRLDVIEGFAYSDKPTLVFSNLLDQSGFKQKNFAIDSLNHPTPLANLGSQIRLEQPLYAGGKLFADLNRSIAFSEASEEMAKRTRQQIIALATEAYDGVLLAQGELATVGKALASARGHLDRTRDLFEKGLVVRSDFLRTEVLVGELEREELRAENRVAISLSRLSRLLGVEGGKFRLTDQVQEDSLPLGGLGSLVSQAKELRPDLKAAEKEMAKAAEAVSAAQADYYPTLGLVTQYEGNTRRFSASGENFAVFVTAKWNLFNGFATREKVTEAEALLRRAKLLRDDLEQETAVEVEENYLGLQASQRQIAVARENVSQAEESLRILKDRYGAGLTRNVDVLDGETALEKAEQDLLRARLSSHIFRTRLNLATGQLP